MSEDANRADPLGDLADFKPGPKAPPAARDTIRDVSELAGFPSRAPRRWRTGRNTQLNLKVSADVLARFAALADRRRIPFGALRNKRLEIGPTKGNRERYVAQNIQKTMADTVPNRAVLDRRRIDATIATYVDDLRSQVINTYFL